MGKTAEKSAVFPRSWGSNRLVSLCCCLINRPLGWSFAVLWLKFSAMIFISYTRRDVSFVAPFEMLLNIAGHQTWRDMNSLWCGDEFPTEIEDGILRSRATVAIITAHTAGSVWQNREIDFALDHRIKVLPVVLGREVPLPERLKGLNAISCDEAADSLTPAQFVELGRKILLPISVKEETHGFDDSSDDLWSDQDSLTEALSGTKWTWIEEAHPEREMWIQFEPNGKVLRSWKSGREDWRALDDSMIFFGPHVLTFDLANSSFKGVRMNRDDSSPIRFGSRIA